jgi:hypothetical protein
MGAARVAEPDEEKHGAALEHVPKKSNDFFDKDMLAAFEGERCLIGPMSPSGWTALSVKGLEAAPVVRSRMYAISSASLEGWAVMRLLRILRDAVSRPRLRGRPETDTLILRCSRSEPRRMGLHALVAHSSRRGLRPYLRVWPETDTLILRCSRSEPRRMGHDRGGCRSFEARIRSRIHATSNIKMPISGKPEIGARTSG